MFIYNPTKNGYVTNIYGILSIAIMRQLNKLYIVVIHISKYNIINYTYSSIAQKIRKKSKFLDV
jgi:hypothetical protein